MRTARSNDGNASYSASHPSASLPPENFWNLEAVSLLLRQILGQNDASRRPDDRVLHACITILSAPLHWFWASNHSLISQATPFADEACETNSSLGRTESCWKTRKRFFCAVRSASHLVLCFNMSPRCVRAMGAFAEHWLYLVTPSKPCMGEGKSGLVETGLTGAAATALEVLL